MGSADYILLCICMQDYDICIRTCVYTYMWYIHICVCMLLCAHMETRGRHEISFSISLPLNFLRHGLSQNLKFTNWLDWLAKKPPRLAWFLLPSPPYSGITDQ